jgi:hypothetical protein
MYYPPMTLDHWLTRRNVWAVNAIGLLLIWIGFLIRLSNVDSVARPFAAFIIFTGGILGVVASTAGALGSKKTSDMQNLGLLIWAGFLFVVVTIMTFGGFVIP